ncbi:hypothetical protein Lepto7375DRAFT_8280 [Leptolyngbya sp. PCC 7375]|nr:hypothetical protein Lepto7375DRAFT_8280 [Leptolyngbya sp. PCC 7375]
MPVHKIPNFHILEVLLEDAYGIERSDDLPALSPINWVLNIFGYGGFI